MDALGICEADFANWYLSRIIDVARPGSRADEQATNATLAGIGSRLRGRRSWIKCRAGFFSCLFSSLRGSSSSRTGGPQRDSLEFSADSHEPVIVRSGGGSSFSPLATICRIQSGRGRCNFSASGVSASSQRSTSSGVVRITGIAFG
jgi:hypothetical protein